jgi:hypothetical protein
VNHIPAGLALLKPSILITDLYCLWALLDCAGTAPGILTAETTAPAGPHAGAVSLGDRSYSSQFNSGLTSAPRCPQPLNADMIGPAVGADLDVMAASVVAAIDQHIANAGGAHFGERDFLRVGRHGRGPAALISPQGSIGVNVSSPQPDQSGSRHKFEHIHRTPLIYLSFSGRLTPCAMALRLMPRSPRRRIRLVTVSAD